MSLSLTSRCSVCSKTDKVLRCQGCKVMFYCSKEHQASDRPAHKKQCNAVKKAQQNLDIEEQRLRYHPGDFMTPDNIFEKGVSHFWGIHETRPYMRARHSKAAVQAALDHVLDLLRLCRSDNERVRSIAPALYLCLGKDQGCYDLLNGDTDKPYLDVKDADTFEEVWFVASKFTDLSFAGAATLLKIRLLLDLKALQNSSLIGKKFPQELLDQIRGQLVSTIVANNKDIMDSEDQGPLIKKLEDQVKQMHGMVGESNKHFWPALLIPEKHLTATLSMYSHGTVPHMQLCLQQSYDSWAETPGAIDMVRKLEKGDDL
ncbi:hypothetical protein DL98DRAFT_546245 [Cadophora sp. DSE1049]|nr:hypothetical protein DL98DRAFT_546245 [Cadophora sp. DSE1049]